MYLTPRVLSRVNAVLVLLLIAGSAVAHHSLVMFDQSKEVTVQGTVTDWQWTNPHSWLDLEVMEAGKSVPYSMECSSPNMLTRKGWNRKALKPGEVVTVKFWAMKSGEKGGLLREVTLPDGTVLVP